MIGEHDTGNAKTTPPELPRRRADELIASLAERLGAPFGASSVFGAPVERDGVTIVPVATVRFGFGGGTGSDPDKHQEGEGAGGGGSMTPAGYIELKDGRSRYVAIVRPERMVAIALMATLVALTVVRSAKSARPQRKRRRVPLIR
jgi:uncharacterized spore protein YtfJ